MAHAQVEDIFSELNDTKYFSTLNLQAGYHHIPLNNISIPKTAFTSSFDKYEYLNVPFGLAQVLAYFQELMNKILKDLPFTIAYPDDIIESQQKWSTPEQETYGVIYAITKWNYYL